MEKSLTSLRDTSPRRNIGRGISLQDKADIVDLAAEVNLLAKRKEKVLEEIDKLEDNSKENRKRLNTEVVSLREEKIELQREVGRLASLLFELKEDSEDIEEGITSYATGRISLISSVGEKLSKTLAKEASTLEERSRDLDSHLLLLTEFVEFYSKYAEIQEESAAVLDSKHADLGEKEVIIKKRLRTSKKRSSEATDALGKANSVLQSADSEYKEADRLSTFFELEADKEKNRLEIWARTVSLRENKTEKQKKINKTFEGELDKREGWLDDRERTLRRNIARLKSQGVKVDL